MVRYVWDTEQKYLYTQPDFKGERITIPCCIGELVFVNILGRSEDGLAINVKLYLPNGETCQGWIGTCFFPPVKLHNFNELFDGRFNQ